jgi:hypothetical protein
MSRPPFSNRLAYLRLGAADTSWPAPRSRNFDVFVSIFRLCAHPWQTLSGKGSASGFGGASSTIAPDVIALLAFESDREARVVGRVVPVVEEQCADQARPVAFERPIYQNLVFVGGGNEGAR